MLDSYPLELKTFLSKGFKVWKFPFGLGMIHALQVIECFFPLKGAFLVVKHCVKWFALVYNLVYCFMSTNNLQICIHKAAAVSGLQIFYSVGRRIFSDGSDGQKLESRHLHSAS